ncbi:hypothetical protein [Bradyrhizobium elkanii]|jgi:hypothetical protein|uniref:hypothetical protein n=1 Tax=Bradyrhizobium elkanii TaxID=29448 RepID=UPI001AEC9346|nr:hypothetical protein [Bradyrhizobium elkanii]
MVEDIPVLCRSCADFGLSRRGYQNAICLTRDAAPRDRRPRDKKYVCGSREGRCPGAILHAALAPPARWHAMAKSARRLYLC